MSRSRILKAPVALLLLVLFAAACSSSGSKADGDKAAFCKTNSDINAELQKATTPEDALAAFKKFEGQFDAYLKNAPAEVKSAAQTQVDFARKAISDNDPKALNTVAKDVTDAGNKVDSFCGVKSTSSSDSNSSSTGSDSSSSSDSGSSATDATGNAAVCAAFQDIQNFSQVAAGVATKSWPEIQALFSDQKDKIAEAYSNVAKNAPDTVAADVRLVAAFTDRLITVALATDSAQAWSQKVGSDPDASKAGEAATRMATFAQTQCGINPSAASS